MQPAARQVYEDNFPVLRYRNSKIVKEP